jgi:hypothetical protein
MAEILARGYPPLSPLPPGEAFQKIFLHVPQHGHNCSFFSTDTTSCGVTMNERRGDFCYFTFNSKDLKSVDNISIYAIMTTNSLVAYNSTLHGIFLLTQMRDFDTLASSFSYL